MKNKIVNEALNGNIKEATKNLLNLQLSLWLTGVPISVIGKILFDDDDDETLMEMIGESMIDNIVLNNIISRYNLAYLTTGRISDMFVNFVMPASSRAIDSLTRDIIDIIKGDFEGSKLIKNNSLYKQTINLIEKFN